jgi:hypothetical protein
MIQRCLLPAIALIMEAASTSEMPVNFLQTTRCNNPEDSHLHYSVLRSYNQTADYTGMADWPQAAYQAIPKHTLPENIFQCNVYTAPSHKKDSDLEIVQ